MTLTATDLEVRPCRPSDDRAVVALLSSVLGPGPTGAIDEEFFTWKHRANPFGSSPGLVALHHEVIVGVRLFLRWKLETGGREISAVRAVDTATARACQGLGIFRRLTLDLLAELDREGSVDLVFNTPNQQSRPGYLSMGWREAGTLAVQVAPVRPLRLLRGARTAARTLATAAHPSPTSTDHDAPLPTPPFQTARRLLRERGPEVEALLAEGGTPDGLHTAASLEFLRWRYGAAPRLDYRCVTVETGGRLTGLATGRVRRRGPLVEFMLADVRTRSGDRGAMRALLRAARRAGADHVTLHTPVGSPEQRVARASGYITVPRHGIGLVVNPRRELPLDPSRTASWELTLGDLEVF